MVIEKARWAAPLLLLALMPFRAVAEPNPHAFMEDPGRCLDCHDSRPAASGGAITGDIVTLCRQCHPLPRSMSHPVGIRPDADTPADLPLDSEGTITCSTCHDPHAALSPTASYGDPSLLKRLRGFFTSKGPSRSLLRVTNDRGQLCLSCHERSEIDTGYLDVPVRLERDYTGSKSCERCHEDLFTEWERSPHARTAQGPRENPGAVKADISRAGELKPEEIEMVIGVLWAQRYVISRGGALIIAPGVWSLVERAWEGSTGREQSWKEDCAGCHLTGFDPYADTYVEKGVGCEMCHGPGGDHVRSGRGEAIVNPARLEKQLADSICASCHTIGHDRTGQFRYPVGYLPGKALELYFRGLRPHAGQGTDTFRGDGTLQDRLRSYRFWLDNPALTSRIVCKQCNTMHILPDHEAPAVKKILTRAAYCRSCHAELPAGPQHDLSAGAGPECLSCHVPLKDSSGRPSIHDHKFGFGR